MPCYDPQGAEDHRNNEERVRLLAAKVDTLTDYLCRTGRSLELRMALDVFPEDVKSWYLLHKRWDEGRGGC